MNNSVKLNSRNIINDHVASDLEAFVAKHSNFQEMNALQHRYAAIIREYQTTPELNILSTVAIDRLETFQRWIPEALSNYKKVVPFLISNMFKGDIFSLNMFENLCKHNNQESLLLDYSKINHDASLKETFSQYGGSEDARAIMTAEHWLESSESADIFRSNNELEVLCAAGSMLHMHNDYITC
jgi:hypothetical protein